MIPQNLVLLIPSHASAIEPRASGIEAKTRAGDGHEGGVDMFMVRCIIIFVLSRLVAYMLGWCLFLLCRRQRREQRQLQTPAD